MSQFPRPRMACRHCGQDWDSHGKYCHPIIDIFFIIILILLGILSVFVFLTLIFI